MIEELLKVLVEAGATRNSAARAAEILDRGGSLAEARQVLVDVEPATFDAQLLLAGTGRAVPVEARRG